MRILFLLTLQSMIALLIFSQEAAIIGRVTDSKTKETLVGVSVVAQDGKGTTTDIDGNYTLKVQPGKHFLKFSYIGYSDIVKDVKVDSGATATLDVGLEEKLEELNLVVVSGSKFERRVAEEITSIDVLKPEQLKSANAVTIAEGLNKVS